MRFDPASISVTVLTGDPRHASMDKSVLKRMRFQEVKAFSSLQRSLIHLRSPAVHIALIDHKLDDLSGLDALRALTRNREMGGRSWVMVTSQCRKEYVMDAVTAGCSGFVIRPYSLETLERHIRAAWQSRSAGEAEEQALREAKHCLEQGDFGAAIAGFGGLLAKPEDAISFFNQGMEYLRAQDFGRAIMAFNKALALNELYAEAYRGLAYAHQGRGETEAYHAFLQKAADIFALQDKMSELKEVFAEILKNDPDAINPYNTLGVKLRRGGDYSGALHAYIQALELTPNDENLHYNIAKAHIFANNEEKAREHLQSALAIRADFREAQGLLHTLCGDACGVLDYPQKGGVGSESLLLID